MDDLLELLVRLLDPIVTFLGPHAVAAVAVIGAIVAYINARIQRRREKRLESKIDYIMEGMGLDWRNAEKSKLSVISDRSILTSSIMGTFHALIADVYTRLRAINQYSRSVGDMNKTWLVGLLGYVAYFIKEFTGYNVPDEMVNNLAEIILLLIPLIAMVANMKKGEKTSAEHQLDDGPAV